MAAVSSYSAPTLNGSSAEQCNGIRLEAGLAELRTPTLLLQGGDSPESLTASTSLLAATLPNSRVTVMPGQQHLAMYTAPELFVGELLAFLAEPGPSA